MYEITRRLSDAYCPNPAKNESAHRDAGNAAVDALTIGELAKFFTECKAGPTYCMVKARVQELLKQFPPHIEDKRERALAAVEALKSALHAMNGVATTALRGE